MFRAEELKELEDDHREFLTCLARDIVLHVAADATGARADKITKRGVNFSEQYESLIRLILRCRYLYDTAVEDEARFQALDDLCRTEKLPQGRPKKAADPYAPWRAHYEEEARPDELLKRPAKRPPDPLVNAYVSVRDWWADNTGQPFHLHFNDAGDYSGYSPAGKLLLIISRDCLGDLEAGQEPSLRRDADCDPLIARLRELHRTHKRKPRVTVERADAQ